MNQKRFQYQNKDIPFLKKDIKARMFFMVLFGIVFFMQMILLILNVIDGTATLTMAIVSAIIMLVSLVFSILSLIFAFKDIQAIDVIKKTGFVVSSISLMPSIEKNSFTKLYSTLTYIIAFAMLIALVGIITYSILQFVYFTTVSFYLPLMLLVTVCGFNSAYHIKHEIEIIQTVLNFQTAF